MKHAIVSSLFTMKSALCFEARHQLHLDITDKHTTLELDGECYYLNNNSANIGFQVNPTRTVKGSVTPETWDSFSNYKRRGVVLQFGIGVCREGSHGNPDPGPNATQNCVNRSFLFIFSTGKL